ncbi:DUF4303 domain-containing protein [Pseudoalteromonas carrageenovora]|uniref:DUF4303 domain-containing protein n=1 Tax=Pseudoalteromonas carrageenovora TaxID=227 RepID=UPI0026E48FC4|nr:DUF4303 domain-containing protein [Pseudoalteromonas carrageenovora]MDO6547718.1 DUF4303 domain-containing protein [Pseudoalteromonas carrageenovora]MDO6832425.1 DUF4303 domain-containing protein [Pseudoalteromonas carrageenovora]MDO6836392.1 DUF4303 domain-containing protein [Pseudoalteromonas carrageenovora]
MNKIENFENTLYKESKVAFTKIIEEHGNELYVIGFYFTGSYSLLPMFNTLSGLKKVHEEEYDNEDDDFLLAKWNVSDFPSLEMYSEYFNDTEKACYEFDDIDYTASDDQINEQWQQWLSALERVLIQLDSEGVFANGIDRNKITIAILAYDETEAVQFERIKRINPPIVLENIKIDFDTMIANRNEIEQSVLAKFEGVS